MDWTDFGDCGVTAEQIMPLARKHGFAGCEVGVRMVGLINEILIDFEKELMARLARGIRKAQ